MDERRVLVSTIAPVSGGVPTMSRFVIDALRRQGWQPVLAHYEPYSVSPALSVPAFRLLRGRPGAERRTTWGELETHALGAWLPELEFTHYWPTGQWQALMESCGRFVAVCGNALAALPFAMTGRPFVGWVATGWEEDRRDRVRAFPVLRRWMDRGLNAHVLRRLERRVLRAGRILPLSRHTGRVLDGLAGHSVCQTALPMPIDADFFRPSPERVVPGRIGFSGRLDDPRKNIGLLIEAFTRLSATRPGTTLSLVGGKLRADDEQRIAQNGIGHLVKRIDYLPRSGLRDWLQTLDVFVVPSTQEGLCISALEAMAAGCPVVSTRCGGPEEFVLDGRTGWLTDFDVHEMADLAGRLVDDRPMRQRLGEQARQLMQERYSQTRCEDIFLSAFEAVRTDIRGENG